MNNFLSIAMLQTPPQAIRRSLPHALLASVLALAVALPCTPLLADEASDVAAANATSTAQEAVAWMSGGIGDDARDQMRKAAASYNVHVVFSERAGSYLADIPFSVSARNGQKIYAGVSEGPLLYLQLQPGFYQIAAQLDGVWQSKRVQVGTSRAPARLSFVARGE